MKWLYFLIVCSIDLCELQKLMMFLKSIELYRTSLHCHNTFIMVEAEIPTCRFPATSKHSLHGRPARTEDNFVGLLEYKSRPLDAVLGIN